MKILILHYHHTSSICNDSENLDSLDKTISALDPRLKIFKSLQFEVKIFPLNCIEYIRYYSRFLNLEFLPDQPALHILDLLHKLLEKLNLDIVYITRPLDVPNSILKSLKMASKRTKWVCYYGAEVKLPIKEAFSEYDHVISGWKQIINYLKKQNVSVSYLPHFYDEAIVNKLYSNKLNKNKIYDVTFAGALTIGGNEFIKRRKYLELIAEKYNLTLFSQIPPDYENSWMTTKLKFQAFLYDIAHCGSYWLPKLPFIKRYKSLTKRPNPEIFISKKLCKLSQNPVFGEDYFEVIMQSKISINCYGNINACDGTLGPLCGNIRTFEVTGAGTCLLTEDASNVSEFFEPDRELVTFSSRESAVSKIKFLLDNPKEREAIAACGRNRALRDHTLEKRVPQLREIIEKKVL